MALGDDKENLAHHLGHGDAPLDSLQGRFKADPLGPQGSFLARGTVSRESSMPPSRASNSELNSLAFGSFGHHTPESSITSQPMARKMPGADAPAMPLPESTTIFMGRASLMSPTMRSR